MTNEKRFENWLKTQKNKTVEEYKKLSDSTQKKYMATFKKWVLDEAKKRAEEAKKEEAPAATEATQKKKRTKKEATETNAPKEEAKPKKVKVKAEPIITLEGLKDAIESHFNENYEWSTHTDPKKKKVMVRWKGSKMLFKVFIQKDKIKVHLKTKEAWEAYSKTNTGNTKIEPFYQNGFNLPYAVKMDLADFNIHFMRWVFTDYVDSIANAKADSKKDNKKK